MTAATFTRGTVFVHGRLLDPTWVPGPGQRHADGPRATCRVTAVRGDRVYYGFGATATRGHAYSTAAKLLAGGAVVQP